VHSRRIEQPEQGHRHDLGTREEIPVVDAQGYGGRQEEYKSERRCPGMKNQKNPIIRGV
jgi:hypothetical protein